MSQQPEDRIDSLYKDVDPVDPALMQQQKDLFISQMSTTQGRLFVHTLLTMTAWLGDPISDNPGFTAYNVGKQQIGREIFALLQAHCPELYETMLTEVKELDNYVGRTTNNTSADSLAGDTGS